MIQCHKVCHGLAVWDLMPHKHNGPVAYSQYQVYLDTSCMISS